MSSYADALLPPRRGLALPRHDGMPVAVHAREGLALDTIAAVVIGGTSLFGGKGKIIWTVFGVIFFVLLSNSLNLMNLSSFHIDMMKGAVILCAALLDVARTRLSREVAS